eukprot:1688458-Amphidinium_carterae.2
MSRHGLDGLEASGTFEKRQPHWVDGWRQRAYILRDMLRGIEPRLLDFSCYSWTVVCTRNSSSSSSVHNCMRKSIRMTSGAGIYHCC